MTSRARILNGITETRAPIPPKLVLQPSATKIKVTNAYLPVALVSSELPL